MTKVKICGITNLQDALMSVKAGADALGFNFYERSPRFILPEKTGKIVAWLPEGVMKVGVFVNESFDKIVETAEIAGLNAVQLHGDESPQYAAEIKQRTGLEVIKAFRVKPDLRPEDVLNYNLDAILLDAYSPKGPGGTGETFDWEIAKLVQEIFPKMYLAGGLSPENVAAAVEKVRPFSVDVSSGIESSPGKKDPDKVTRFIEAAKTAI